MFLSVFRTGQRRRSSPVATGGGFGGLNHPNKAPSPPKI